MPIFKKLVIEVLYKDIPALSIFHLMQSLVITTTFWERSSLSECEEINDQQEAGNRPGSERSSEEVWGSTWEPSSLVAGSGRILPFVFLSATLVFFSLAEDLNKYFDFLLLP